MYRNIIFDLGGVLVDFSPETFLVDHFMNERTERKLYDITFGSEEWIQLDAGLITRAQANEAMRKKAAILGCSFEVDVILNDWFDMLKTKDEAVQLLKRLHHRGYRLFYLSNIASDVLELLQQRKFWRFFEGGIASCQVGINKPDDRIYQILLRQYQLLAQECIFLDDRRENAIAASRNGITGLHYRGIKPSLAQMIQLGISFDKKAPPIPQPQRVQVP